jgi:hypothetical protein
VVISAKTLEKGKLEIKKRASKEVEFVSEKDLLEKIL